MNLKISIIVPIYNGEKVIKKCIDSVLNQTFKDWELIIINDCSIDKTDAIIKKYMETDTRIKYINETQNVQSLLARIHGLKIATGDYIAFLDGDDWMHKNALNALFENALKTNADVVFGAWRRVFDNYGFIKTKPLNLYYDQLIEGVFEKEEIEENFGYSYFANHGLPVINWAKLHKRELLDNVLNYPFPKIIKGTDLYLNLLIFQNVNKISFIKDVIVYYRDGGVSQTLKTNYLNNVDELYQLRKKILENTPKKEQAYNYMNKELANTFFYYFIDCVYIGNYTKEQIKNKYLDIKDNVSYQDFIVNLPSKDILHYDFFKSIESNDFDNAYELIGNEINKFKFKRGLRRTLGNLLLKI
tara:strand:+ start:915 stop:1988 length:1074 start_codon:yes stop_codon:yes gene_type:complete